MPSFSQLPHWLSYIESIHSQEIDLGLKRIQQVAQRMSIDFSFAKVITVAGTNGKGTTCAFIEHALHDLQQSVAVYSSPHIHQFNERLRINKQLIDDTALIEAFAVVEQARAEISLSYYEFTTLACFYILIQQQPSYIILEVGLGGRLDATNIIDADLAVITTVDLDHQAFLGETREAIGFEKAGIMRANKPVVIGEANAPDSVSQYAKQCGAKVIQLGSNYQFEPQQHHWCWHNKQHQFNLLPLPHIPTINAATALAVLTQLPINIEQNQLNNWLTELKVEGRLEWQQDGEHQLLFDVGHNPQAANYLANYLNSQHKLGKFEQVHAIVAMMKDKAIEPSLMPFNSIVSTWYCPNLSIERAEKGQQTAAILSDITAKPQSVNHFDNIEQAYKMAVENAKPHDLILVFGSFFTVAEVKDCLAKEQRK